MRKTTRRIIKYFIFSFSAFIFLNIYFPPSSEASKEKVKDLHLNQCEKKNQDQSRTQQCKYDMEIISPEDV